MPVDRSLIPKLWREKRMHKYVLPDGRRSEELAQGLERGWRDRSLEPALLEKLDALAAEWRGLQVGRSLTLDWPRPEGRKRRPPRRQRRPATARR